jgi:hypothetical protein
MWWRIGFSGFDSVIGLAGPFARHGEGACHENKAQADDFVPARKFTTSKFRLNAHQTERRSDRRWAKYRC